MIKRYANGGTVDNKINAGDVLGLASGFINPVSAIPSALGIIQKLAYNPASYTPARMNESPRGYADGGKPGDPGDPAKDYYRKLYKSPFYKNLGKEQGIKTPANELSYDVRNVNVFNTKDAKGKPRTGRQLATPKDGDPMDIYADPNNDLETVRQLYLGRSDRYNKNSDWKKQRSLSKDILEGNARDNVPNHNEDNTRADINAVRYALHKEKLWDMKSEITKEQLDKLRKLPAYKDNEIIKRGTNIKQSFDNKNNTIKLLNTVAYNNSPDENVKYAAYGADLQNKAQVTGGNDIEMGEHATQIQGNPGIDTNRRNIGGQEVALTKGEIVRQDGDGSAYIWSNNPKMLHPSGKTFAQAMKPIENKIANIKRRINRDPSDNIASSTLGHLEQMVEQNKNIEESMRQAKGSPTAMKFNQGGYVPGYYDGGPKDPLINNNVMDIMVDSALEKRFQNPLREGFENYSMVQNRNKNQPFSVSPTLSRSNSPFTNPSNFLQANPSPLTAVKEATPSPQENLSTFEDKAFMGTKALETAFRVGTAMQKPTQYDTRRYNVDKIKYNANKVLDVNERNYQGSQFDINTGNANTDRILRNNLYSQKSAADRDTMRQYDEMQRNSDFQVNQYNAQSKANVDNINEQIRGRQYQAVDAAASSVGNLASIFQQAGAAKTGNKISLATLNSLSKRYGIDMSNLMDMIDGKGDSSKGTIKYKGK